MAMHLLEALLIAVSLCADCFAVSLCSGVRMLRVEGRTLVRTALVFAVIQSSFLALGWILGSAVEGLFHSVAHFIGFALLLFVGGEMLLDGIRNRQEELTLDSWWHIVLGGVATSIDAMAVGASQSLAGVSFGGVLPLVVSVFAVTALSVLAGLLGGKRIGTAFGRWAEIFGGIVLIAIGVSLLF